MCDLDELGSAEIKRRLSAGLESALLRLSPTCRPPATRFLHYPSWSRTMVEGRSFRRVTARFPWSKGLRLVVGEYGASLVADKDHVITVMYDACAIAVVYSADLFEMYGEDGFRIRLELNQWRNGGAAVAALLERLPDKCVIRMRP